MSFLSVVHLASMGSMGKYEAFCTRMPESYVVPQSKVST